MFNNDEKTKDGKAKIKVEKDIIKKTDTKKDDSKIKGNGNQKRLIIVMLYVMT